ncbi:hypothetical protein Nepgr_013521 [Nepenthes gracilis]|uniref:Uncharacterized protein n=1 Tax=Nepenthes gracilis TaxID=150966 RepID=A0AAD3SJ05_NEPGR|nr:hypothetical protein Nepgr_013521 [Nepenthes gracilis]
MNVRKAGGISLVGLRSTGRQGGRKRQIDGRTTVGYGHGRSCRKTQAMLRIHDRIFFGKKYIQYCCINIKSMLLNKNQKHLPTAVQVVVDTNFTGQQITWGQHKRLQHHGQTPDQLSQQPAGQRPSHPLHKQQQSEQLNKHGEHALHQNRATSATSSAQQHHRAISSMRTQHTTAFSNRIQQQFITFLRATDEGGSKGIQIASASKHHQLKTAIS